MGQKTEAHLSRASKWQNWDSTWNFGTKDQAVNLIHLHQVDANIYPHSMEGQTEDGGDLVSLHLGANKILSSNMLKWGLNLTFLLWSSTVLRIFI